MTPHLNLQMIKSHQSQTTPKFIAIKDVISELGQSAWPGWLQSERWPSNWWWISVHWFVLIASCQWILGEMRSHCWGLNSYQLVMKCVFLLLFRAWTKIIYTELLKQSDLVLNDVSNLEWKIESSDVCVFRRTNTYMVVLSSLPRNWEFSQKIPVVIHLMDLTTHLQLRIY